MAKIKKYLNMTEIWHLDFKSEQHLQTSQKNEL